MTEGEFAEFILGGFLSAVVTSCLCIYLTDNSWRTEMVKRGYAEYDSKTAAWKWSDGE